MLLSALFFTSVGMVLTPPPADLAALAPILHEPVRGANLPLEFTRSPPCEQPPQVHRGTASLITGLALAGQGLASHIAFSAMALRAGTSDALGLEGAYIFGLGTLTYASLASSLSLLGVSAYRKGRWNAYRTRCLGEKRTKPRLTWGLSLLGLGSAVLLGTLINNRYFRPDCDYCRAVVVHAGSGLGMALVFPGLALTTYSAGFRR